MDFTEAGIAFTEVTEGTVGVTQKSKTDLRVTFLFL